MAQTFKGPVVWISYEEKYGNYALRLKGKDGFFKSSKPWPDGVKKGATVELIARDHPKSGFEVKPGSITVTEAPKGKGGGYRGKGGGGFRKDPETQARITWQHSQEMAIQAAEVLLANDAYKLGAKNKPEERFTQIVALIDDLTVKFFNDVESRQPAKDAKEVEDELNGADDTGGDDWDDDSDSSGDESWDDSSKEDDDDEWE